MYCDLFEDDDNQPTPPSQQLINLYASLRVTLRQWFARMCIFLDLPIRFANDSPILPLYISPYCDQFKDMFYVHVSSPWEPEEQFVITDKDNVIRVLLVNKDSGDFEYSEDDVGSSEISKEIVIDLTADESQNIRSDDGDITMDDDDISAIVAIDESAFENEAVSDYIQLPTIKGVPENIEDDSTVYSKDDITVADGEEGSVSKPWVCMLRTVMQLRSNGNRIRFRGIPLIWDTGAGDDVFDIVPPGAYNFRTTNNSILLGGSSQHEVNIRTKFDIGFLKDVLLLPREVRLGCCIISAGKLQDLRTFQYDTNKFYVVNNNGVIISEGIIGDDRIFYLLDNNLLRSPRLVVRGGHDVRRILGTFPLTIGSLEEHHSENDTLQGVHNSDLVTNITNANTTT
jgi:hypothetical protein